MMPIGALRMRNPSAGGGGGGGDPHLYWRMYISETSANWPVITDIEWRATADGSDQSPVCTTDDMSPLGIAIADSEAVNSGAFHAYDSSSTTLWATNGSVPPAWIGFHFPSPVSVAEVAFTTLSDTRFLPKSFVFEYSDDGSTWASDGTPYTSQATVGGATFVYPRVGPDPASGTKYTFDSGSIASALSDAATEGWTITAFADAANGHTKALTSPDIGDGASTSFDFTVTGPHQVRVRWQVSSEATFDFARIKLDGVELAKDSGTSAVWNEFAFQVPTGSHTVTIAYTKDGSASHGTDNVMISEIIVY